MGAHGLAVAVSRRRGWRGRLPAGAILPGLRIVAVAGVRACAGVRGGGLLDRRCRGRATPAGQRLRPAVQGRGGLRALQRASGRLPRAPIRDTRRASAGGVRHAGGRATGRGARRAVHPADRAEAERPRPRAAGRLPRRGQPCAGRLDGRGVSRRWPAASS